MALGRGPRHVRREVRNREHLPFKEVVLGSSPSRLIGLRIGDFGSRVGFRPEPAPSPVGTILAMAGELLPPPELAPPVPEDTTFEERLALWVDLMNACEQFLLAGLRREIGPEGDLKAAHRRWYEQQMEEHDRTMLRLVEELHRRLGPHG